MATATVCEKYEGIKNKKKIQQTEQLFYDRVAGRRCVEIGEKTAHTHTNAPEKPTHLLFCIKAKPKQAEKERER